MESSSAKKIIIALVVSIVVISIITISNLSSVLMMAASIKNAKAGTEVIYRQVDANGQSSSGGSSSNSQSATPAGTTPSSSIPSGSTIPSANTPSSSDNSATASNADVEKAVKLYNEAISKAKSSAKTVTLAKDGATNYNDIFNAGPFSSFAPMLKGFFKVEDKNEAIDKSTLPGDGKLVTSNVEKATVNEANGVYTVELILKQVDNPAVGDGGVGSAVGVISMDEITGGVSKVPGVSLSNIKLQYGDGQNNALVKVTATIDKATGNLTELSTDAPSILYLDAKAPIIGEIKDASVGIEVVSVYKIGY